MTGTAISTFAPSDAGYVRLRVARFNQDASTDLCRQRPRGFNSLQAASQSIGGVASDAWRRFLGENTISGMGVRVFLGADAEAASDESALSDIIFNQVVIPKKFKNCQPDARNGAALSPMASLTSGSPIFAARVRRWYTNSVSDEAITRISTVGTSAGTIAGLPAPLAASLAGFGSRTYRADVEASMGSRVSEMFNPSEEDAGRIVRVFTGYSLPTEENPDFGHRAGASQYRFRNFVKTDTAYPYADIMMVTVASIFDQRSSSFAQAKALGEVQRIVDSPDILEAPLLNARAERDTLNKIFALAPDVAAAISSYQQAPSLDLLEERCKVLSGRLQKPELGLSRQDAHVILLALAKRHQQYGSDAPDPMRRDQALSRPCMGQVGREVSKLGVDMPAIPPQKLPVGPADRAAVADLLHFASIAGTATAASTVLTNNLAPQIPVNNELSLLADAPRNQSLSPATFAALMRTHFSAIGCSLPTAQDTVDVSDQPFTPVGAGELKRTMVAVMVSEDGLQRYAGVFQFDPRSAGAAPIVSGLVIQPLTDGLVQSMRTAYPAGCPLLPQPPASTPAPASAVPPAITPPATPAPASPIAASVSGST
ncbi:hypothetical protein GCM10017620_31120 [Brevundimonas intermedia]|uniref:Uncharacterized protein n=1 Tax=Brevundimonas intermedia TaxID=74315 RepID=A0ABQ5TCR3_9CAUL|nr:hypothetical protein GCM10017620_31120 [Brevundimonas intermedia]